MSRKANPSVIGLFLIVGLGLAVGGVFLFSSRSFFHPKQEFILYFNASLDGLNPGAPVKYRGVTIGSVHEVLIRHNQSPSDFSMPVIIHIDKKVAQAKSDEHLQIGSQTRLDDLIRQGFRGRLDSDSLVTGVLYVGLDLVPNAAPPTFHQLSPEYQELPTVPSQFQQLFANLESLDIHGLSEKLNALMSKLNTKLSQLDVAAINAGVTNLLADASQFITSPDLTNAVAALDRTLNHADGLVKRVDGRVDPLVDSATNTLDEAQVTLADLRRAIQNLSTLIGPESSFGPDLTQALEDLGDAGRAVADLAEYLQRNPNSLLVGRKQPKEKP